MLVITDKSIHIDHIIWQPRFSCTKRCLGCYIYNEKPKCNLTDPLNKSIIKLINERLVSCDQLTISLDHRDACDPIDKELVSTLTNVLFNLPYPIRQTLKICLSVDSIDTFDSWCVVLNVSRKSMCRRLYMVSISKPGAERSKLLEFINVCNINGAIFNYNKLIESIETIQTEEFEIGCRFANLINLVFEKRALGSFVNSQVIREKRKLLDLAKITAQALSRKNNVTLDICCVQKDKYKETGTTCSAGKNKLVVWPDGSATACPYDVNHINTKINFSNNEIDTFKEIYTAISSLSPCYKCNIV